MNSTTFTTGVADHGDALTVGDVGLDDPFTRLAEETVRLRAVVSELQHELAQANDRAVELADRERRQLERNLHDGAQQRLLVLAINLQSARACAEAGDAREAAVRIENALRDLDFATDELRELARGAHPQILADYGLSAAVVALAERTPMRVTLAALPDHRLPLRIETTAYFVIAEAVANAIRHAHAHIIAIAVRVEGATTVVEVRDDGVGGAEPSRGSGLRGLHDRVDALDGELETISPSGEGTLVRATMPTRRLALVRDTASE